MLLIYYHNFKCNTFFKELNKITKNKQNTWNLTVLVGLLLGWSGYYTDKIF